MLADAGLFSIACDVAPFRLSGTVYGALLNHRSALAALGPAVRLPPYNAPPVAPVLYIKPRNTLALPDSVVSIPPGTPELEVGACLGLVIGRTAWVAAHALSTWRFSPRRARIRASPVRPSASCYDTVGAVTACRGGGSRRAETVPTSMALAHTSNTADRSGRAQLLADVSSWATLRPEMLWSAAVQRCGAAARPCIRD